MARKNYSNSKTNMKTQTLFGEIHVSIHCIKRYALRLQLELVDYQNLRDKSTQITYTEAEKRIINEVKQSRLLSFRGKDDLRIYKGNMYIVGKSKKGGYDAITMLISKVTQKELFAERFDGEVCYDKFLNPKKDRTA